METVIDALTGGTPPVVEEQKEPASEIPASDEPRLWAGKFKTPEDLEEGYKNSAKVFNEKKELEEKIKSLTFIPDIYESPEGILLRSDQLTEIKSIAKNARLTQEQFNATAKEMADRIQYQVKIIEEEKQALGDEKVNVLRDYVKRTTKIEKLHDILLNILIKDKDAMNEALKHRDELLNSQIPGLGQGNITMEQKYEGEKELLEAVKKADQTGRSEDKNRVIRLAKEVAEARKERQ